MGRKIIWVKEETKAMIEARKWDGESWDDFIMRMASGNAQNLMIKSSLRCAQKQFRYHLTRLDVGECIACDFEPEGIFKVTQTLRRVRSRLGTRLLFRAHYDKERAQLVMVATRFPDDYAGGTMGKDWQPPEWKFVKHYGVDESLAYEPTMQDVADTF